MLNRNDILETIRMIDQQHLDIRTITMGISLLSCADRSAERACEKIYDKISRYAERLVATGEEIEREFGIPIVNKRVSVTPIALVAAASETEDYVPFAKALDRAAKNVGVNFIGGFSALVQKGMTDADRKLIAAIHRRLFGAGAQGLFRRGRAAHPQHPGGAGLYGPCVFISQRRLVQGGNQHGCCRPDGADGEKDGGAHGKTGRLWLRQACDLLQCGRG